MKATKTLDWANTLCGWVLGGIFIYAGAAKLMAPATFAVLIEAYGILPEILVMPVAIALPVLEMVAGLGVLTNIRGSLGTIAALLLLFVAIMGYGLWMGLDVDCGCFGPEEPEAKAFHSLAKTLYRDLTMLAGVAWMYGWRRYRTIPSVDIRSIVLKKNNEEMKHG